MLATALLIATATAHALAPPAPDTPFLQETHHPYLLESADANDVRAIAVWEGHVYAGTRGGLYAQPLDAGQPEWQALMPAAEAGPVFDVTPDGDRLWVAAWNGLWQWDGADLQRTEGVPGPVSYVAAGEGGALVALGPEGLWRRTATGAWRAGPMPFARSIRAAHLDADGTLWVATGMGLYQATGERTRLFDDEQEIIAANVHGLARDTQGRLWAAGLGGVTVYAGGAPVKRLTTADGLPSANCTVAVRGPRGHMWIGTELGVARWEGERFAVRWNKRWLLNNAVRDIAFGPEGDAWVATAGGVSELRMREMTLADKADYFYDELIERHVREPWFVEGVQLATPGDRSTWMPEDDDNDGQYTAQYVVMECFRYLVTDDPKARENARKGMQALLRLQTITGTDGFVARTFIPSDWEQMHDANREWTPRERADRKVSDPRYKPVEERWRPTPDGEWLWKGDTSSDEITGHFYFFHYYYDLVATEEEKETLRTHVAKVMDYIIDGGYVLRDIDGESTRWGVWAPERLNEDPDWQAERGVNSAEICSFLLVAHHITGDQKYRDEYERLLFEGNYLENIRTAKNYGASQNTRIDDILLTLTFPALFKYEDDPDILAEYRESLERWYAGIANEQNPWSNFTYGMITGLPPALEDSLFFLRDAPLDRMNWRWDHTLREDIQIVRAPILEQPSTHRLLPPSERAVVRWDKNPWMHQAGDGGRTEWAPTFWLLPYWQGRYAGYIAAPEE